MNDEQKTERESVLESYAQDGFIESHVDFWKRAYSMFKETEDLKKVYEKLGRDLYGMELGFVGLAKGLAYYMKIEDEPYEQRQ